MLRLPDGMRDRIKRAAAENSRSMNAEIVATLENAYPDNAYRSAVKDAFVSVLTAPAQSRESVASSLSKIVRASWDESFVYDFEEGMKAALSIASMWEKEQGRPMTEAQIQSCIEDVDRLLAEYGVFAPPPLDDQS